MANVNTPQLINDARQELKERVGNRQANDKRIAELRILLKTLVRFMPDDTNRQAVLAEVEDAKRKAPSLTDSVSDLLMHSKSGMTSTEVREALEQSGFDLDEYSQPLGAIMTVLKRLTEGDTPRIKRGLRKDKNIVFTWIAEKK